MKKTDAQQKFIYGGHGIRLMPEKIYDSVK